jgi:hypothetical protein
MHVGIHMGYCNNISNGQIYAEVENTLCHVTGMAGVSVYFLVSASTVYF